MIFNAGLIDRVSNKTKDFISDNPEIAQAITMTKGPSLEPNMSLQEYILHITKVFKVPSSQMEFYKTITKICYLMLMAEKNPLIAHELKGSLQISTALETIMKV